MKDHLSTAELGALLGISDQSVRGLARGGIIAKAGRTFPLEGTVRSYVAHLRRVRPATSASESAAANRGRLAAAKADIAVFDLERRRGEFVSLAEVESYWTSVIKQLRAALLSVSARVAARTGLSREQAAIADEEIRAALASLADSGEGIAELAEKEAWRATTGKASKRARPRPSAEDRP